MTLPTRLKKGIHRPSSLGEFESVLNSTGSRNIFELRASIVPAKGAEEAKILDGNEGRSFTSTLEGGLEIDYSPRRSQTTIGRTPHRFSQVEVRRNIPEGSIPSGAEDEVDDQVANVEM